MYKTIPLEVALREENEGYRLHISKSETKTNERFELILCVPHESGVLHYLIEKNQAFLCINGKILPETINKDEFWNLKEDEQNCYCLVSRQ